ncbi:WD40-repeat-containing domain [Pseudocohnilembus persalinus]|uniref:WD40-repeat-containing domain n=1 Tax=Pseudocohnilembus persalinus TaxID=266149 RepID=A0A0V0QTH4_PSEPJ|nr:WD40-repeat-containing domain [Pseudocohnilembus persalinus]|eukprot:KRX05453.1 WD40-repeat-containing domain [Pseudocohnilembus persalinus]
MGVITIYQLKFKKQKLEFKNPSQILGEGQNLLQIIKILQFQAHETQIKQAVTLQNREGQFLITGGQNRNISVWRLNDILPKHIYNEIQLEQNVSQIYQNQNNNQNQNFQKFINNQNFFNNYDVSQIIEGIQPYKIYEKVHTKEITDLEQFNNGIYFASASLDQTVCVFDINKNDQKIISYDINNLSDCLYLEDSQSLLAFNEDSMIQYIGYQE